MTNASQQLSPNLLHGIVPPVIGFTCNEITPYIALQGKEECVQQVFRNRNDTGTLTKNFRKVKNAKLTVVTVATTWTTESSPDKRLSRFKIIQNNEQSYSEGYINTETSKRQSEELSEAFTPADITTNAINSQLKQESCTEDVVKYNCGSVIHKAFPADMHM